MIQNTENREQSLQPQPTELQPQPQPQPVQQLPQPQPTEQQPQPVQQVLEQLPQPQPTEQQPVQQPPQPTQSISYSSDIDSNDYDEDDEDINSDNFEVILKQLHDSAMKLKTLSVFDYKRLTGIIETLETAYEKYQSPNAQYLLDNMKDKAKELNPQNNTVKNAVKFVSDLKDYLSSFFQASVNFSIFKNNKKDLNEQFNEVLQRLIGKLKRGDKHETYLLTRLLKKLINEMTEQHKIDKNSIKPDDFLSRLKALMVPATNIVKKTINLQKEKIIEKKDDKNKSSSSNFSGAINLKGENKSDSKSNKGDTSPDNPLVITLRNAITDMHLTQKKKEC